jgi:hypothetical protein
MVMLTEREKPDVIDTNVSVSYSWCMLLEY